MSSTPTPQVPSSAADALSLLTTHHPPASATEILTTKVLLKPLPLHPTADARTHRRNLKASTKTNRKPSPLSAKEKRLLNVHSLPNLRKLSYDTFVPLHTLWLGYARSLSAMRGGALALAQRLAAGDLHGAFVEVVRSRAVDRVGISGIVVKETRGTLVIVTRGGGGGKTVPKEFTVFRLCIPPSDEEREKLGRTDMVFELQGSQLMFRAAERAGRKFKAKPMLDL